MIRERPLLFLLLLVLLISLGSWHHFSHNRGWSQEYIFVCKVARIFLTLKILTNFDRMSAKVSPNFLSSHSTDQNERIGEANFMIWAKRQHSVSLSPNNYSNFKGCHERFCYFVIACVFCFETWYSVILGLGVS